jgi:hypothetical protein
MTKRQSFREVRIEPVRGVMVTTDGWGGFIIGGVGSYDVTDGDRGGAGAVKRPRSEDLSSSTREDSTATSTGAGVAT